MRVAALWSARPSPRKISSGERRPCVNYKIQSAGVQAAPAGRAAQGSVTRASQRTFGLRRIRLAGDSPAGARRTRPLRSSRFCPGSRWSGPSAGTFASLASSSRPGYRKPDTSNALTAEFGFEAGDVGLAWVGVATLGDVTAVSVKGYPAPVANALHGASKYAVAHKFQGRSAVWSASQFNINHLG
jgi:hypothetical protein